ncbi:hypothetical protein AKJ09_11364 [Labilithrix luteola]|uniref:DUF4398 domain-containing protein n=1 Tax=Labilithrix luteola TaxID=1391654 RepID=A0A0K1QG01_9BACT|nr:DUF4398 domain-containing protein [Labilithrix luteola]AKV04701.1 hypothetical protein AKJ09_11364 [Labilithrix luteola]
MRSMISLLIAVAAVATGCATGGPVPANTLANTRAAVRSAEEMGAVKDPTAALHLRLAHEELDSGKKLIMEGDQDRARYVLMRSEADANVALNRSREAQAKMEAQKSLDDLRTIRSSMPSGSMPSVPSPKEGM